MKHLTHVSGSAAEFTRRAVLAATLLAVVPWAGGPAAAADWKPTRPINLIVPWAAGGATDQVLRVVASELEKSLGQTIVVINQPGASGAIGTKSALDAARDGYVWTGGAVQDLGTYETLGSVKTRVADWNLFLCVANVPVLSVPAKSEAKSAAELIAAMKAKPGAVKVSTAGLTSSGHAAMDTIAAAAGVTYRHVAYDGGNPAVVAATAGEVDATTQLASEQADLIRGKMIRPLAAVGDKPLDLEGFGRIPALSDTLPGFKAPLSYYGIFVPKGVPAEVTETLTRLWAEQIAKSEALQAFAQKRGALFAPSTGEAAQAVAFPAVQANAWSLFDSGKAKVSPDTVGIPRP
ncbi:tripartite tricarboxylate transporter substrate binding protein [Siculibacillus lacustris]|uniref:Tripartite tricarboxylate transporter substrate binding protein n=1 Tax=Siculibacillus lacustris TaxID=1549641 RepID=A0A4Q9VT44_9HYPH|nr:tripartite tricarboxylate transporter substrate binding protein [Siculibacillus lacustris]TBW38251.1 tripartite tricarboxylate transporter substrate binding protein [Siculibacillus lacustris]